METRKVQCLSCKEIVEVKLLPFGGGFVAVCPKCSKLAYNENEVEEIKEVEKDK